MRAALAGVTVAGSPGDPAPDEGWGEESGFRHLKTVTRIIGAKRGTGGSSGVNFLKAALDLTFFPEVLAVRTEIG